MKLEVQTGFAITFVLVDNAVRRNLRAESSLTRIAGKLLADGVEVARAVDIKPVEEWYRVAPAVENLILDLKDNELSRSRRRASGVSAPVSPLLMRSAYTQFTGEALWVPDIPIGQVIGPARCWNAMTSPSSGPTRASTTAVH